MLDLDIAALIEGLPWQVRYQAMLGSTAQVAIIDADDTHLAALVGLDRSPEHEVQLEFAPTTTRGRPATVLSWCPCTDFVRDGSCRHVGALLAHLRGTAPAESRGTPRQRLVANEAPLFPSRPLWELRLRGIGTLAKTIEQEKARRALPENAPAELVFAVDAVESEREERLVFGVWGRWARANGTPGKLRKVPLDDDLEIDAIVPSHLDARLCTLLVRASQPTWGTARHLRGADPDLVAFVFPMLARERALRLRRREEPPELPLGWSVAPWRIEILGEERRGDALRLRPILGDGLRQRELADALLVTDRLVLFPDELGLLETAPATVAWLRRGGVVDVPHEEAEAAIELSASIVGRAALSLPAPYAWREVEIPLVPRLVVSLDRHTVTARGEARYEHVSTRLDSGAQRIVDEIDRRLIVRDMAAEARFASRLDALLAAAPDPLAVDDLVALATTLDQEGWELTVGERRLRIARTPRLRVATGIDWFGLEVGIDFGDLTLDTEAALAISSEGTIDLPDGSLGLVAEGLASLLGKLGKLARRGKRAEHWLGELDLLVLDELAEARASLVLDAGAIAARARLTALATAAPLEEPPGFVGSLRPYQRAGAGWLAALEQAGVGGCLADDMGLGKTVQVLAFLAARQPRASAATLVVAPRSLVATWLSEAERFVPQLPRVDLSGPDRDAQLEALVPGTLAVTTWGVLRRNARLFADRHFDVVVFDEAQAAKNPEAVGSKAGRALDATVRIALTGTPIENHLGELGAIVELVNPGMVARFDALALLASGKRSADGEELARLSRALRPILLRRRKDEVLPELPERTEQVLYCELGEKQERLYRSLLARTRRDVLDRVRTAGVGRSALHVLEALLRLRQVACHPGLVDPALADAESGKLEVLLARLTELADEGHKALVFSQFTSLLDLVSPTLDRAGIGWTRLDGRTRDREARIARFRTDPECRVFLVSLKAGGVGLTLTEASYVFLLDPWWNPAVEAQAIDRTHRIGQERPVFAYRLVARNTVEERILALQDQKRVLAEAVLAGERGPLAKLSAEDLEILLS